MRICHNNLFLLVILITLTTACTKLEPYRTKTDLYSQQAFCDFKDGNEEVKDCSIEHRYYTAGTPQQKNDYYLATVEFDDQGWFAQPGQMESLLTFLRSERDKKNEDYLIILYAHGWRHNASACDNNVVCFSRLLERMDYFERNSPDPVGNGKGSKKSRTIIGVYVGWIGLSADVQPFELLSFWSRKNAAERVGHGGVTELLVHLNEFREFKNPKREASKTHFVITGHSFGGQVIFAALSQLLIDRGIQLEECGECDKKDTYNYTVAKSFGDLVILVNPAFQGSLYEPLFHAATSRCYPKSQRPIMLVVTSTADTATKTVFPLGRRFNTLFERTQALGQEDTILHTVGHLDRYKTHDLELLTDSRVEESYEEGECGCPYMEETADYVKSIQKSEEAFFTSLQENPQAMTGLLYGPEFNLIKNRTPSKPLDDHYPYLVITTNEDLIPDHNQIYGEDFTNFIRRFYIRHIYLGGELGKGVTKADQMCPVTPVGP